MMDNERFSYENDPGRVNTRILSSRQKELSIEEKRERSTYFNAYTMYCEIDVINRFEKLQHKLAVKNLMFKFDGHKYAVFSLDISDRTQLTDYILTLEELENFAEKV